jgi:hypothetical protein
MSPSAPEQPAPVPDVSLAEEMAAQADEPLLPIEKTLIAGSLILGIALLGLLIWLSNTFFPIPAGPE